MAKNYTRVDRYGDHPLVECSIVLFPDDVNVSLKSKPVYRMPHFHLAPEQASILSRAFSLGDQFAEIDQAVLLLLSYSETLKNHEKYKAFCWISSNATTRKALRLLQSIIRERYMTII